MISPIKAPVIRFATPADELGAGVPLSAVHALRGSSLGRDDLARNEARAARPIAPPLDLEALGYLGILESEGSAAALKYEALLTSLAVEEAPRVGIALGREDIAWQVLLFRERFGLTGAADLRAWLGRAGLSMDELGRALAGLLAVAGLEARYAARIDRELDAIIGLRTAYIWMSGSGAGCAEPDEEIDALLGGPGAAAGLLRRRGLLRILARYEVAWRGIAVSSDDVARITARFVNRFGLQSLENRADWFDAAGLNAASFTQAMRGLGEVQAVARVFQAAVAEQTFIGRALSTARAVLA